MIELQPSTLRNRHTIANDIKTALIKRINRKIQPQNLKVRVGKFGRAYVVNTAYDYTVYTSVDLTELASALGVTNATAGCDVTLPTNRKFNATAGVTITPEVAPSYSSHY